MFLQKLHTVKAFIFDVDGVLTDGSVQVTETGDQLRSFNIKDGYALQLAVKRGYPVAVISGARSQGVVSRLKGLGISAIYIGVEDKVEIYNRFIAETDISPEHIVFMGDDIPDLLIMKQVGLPVCPADAVEEIKAISTYVSPKNGGAGCARDIIEKVLKIQNKWYDEKPSAHDGSLQ